LVAGRAGLPHAGHSWSQLAPPDPWQDIAVPFSHTGSASERTYLRKGKKMPRRQRSEQKV